MKARDKADTTSWFGLPRWIALFVVAGIIAAAGFLLWLTAESFSRSSSLDIRRVRSLNIAADYIAKWPDVATTIAQTSLYYRDQNHRGKEVDDGRNIYFAYLFHPEFGDFRIQYDRSQAQCQRRVEIYKNQMTVRGEALKASAGLPEPEKRYIEAARNASWIPLGQTQNPVCFTIDKLDLAKVAPPLGSFSHLLLIADTAGQKSARPDTGSSGSEQSASADQQASNAKPWRSGRVVAWVGSSELPIRKLSDLPALQSEVSNVFAAAEAAAGASGVKVQPQNSSPKDALEPFDSRVAGKSYRFYWRPIALDDPASSTDASEQPVDYYLVGVAPSGIAPEQGQSRTELVAFAVVLFFVIALIPVVKLALLGPVDSMQAIEVAAMCLGIVAAAALGTALWIGMRDVLVARSVASGEVASTARSLARNVERDLHDALFSDQMATLSRSFTDGRSGELVADKEAKPPRPFIRVENTILLDENGRQAAGTFVNTSRDHVGANFDLSDRVYFRRAIDGDFSPANGLARRLGENACDVWHRVEDGLVFDQIRSRADGAPKTIVAARLNKATPSVSCPPLAKSSVEDERLQPSVAVATFVTWRMVSPRLNAGIRYAVVDLRDNAVGRPVLFHSDSYRAGVELFDDSLNPRTRAKLSAILGKPSSCDLNKDATVETPGTQKFTGVYEDEATLFAVARVPCTDWAVIAFKSQRLVDSQAIKPAVEAILTWASLAILPYFLWLALTLAHEDRAWVWLWPEPTEPKKNAYRLLSIELGGATVVAILLVRWVSPITGFLASSLTAIGALVWLGRVHFKTAAKMRSASRHVSLDHTTERWFSTFTMTLLLAVSVVPIAALAADARAYFAQVSAAQNSAAHQSADENRAAIWNAIAHMEGATSPAEVSTVHEPPLCTDSKCPEYFTERLRIAAGYERPEDLRAAQPTHWLFGFHPIGLVEQFTLFSLALIILALLGFALWATMRGLFGFGVALEAIDYPQLPMTAQGTVDTAALPPRFLLISANQNHLEALKADATEIDLSDAVRNPRARQLPARNPADPPLLLITNLGLLLGDPMGRRQALELLEQILAKQEDREEGTASDEGPCHGYRYRIAILTSLTPLDRLLQSFDRERDEVAQLGEQEQSAARLERAKYREDMRWSAVFEQFTTYCYAAEPRKRPKELETEGPVVQLIWKELEYLPDPAVAAMIGGHSPLSDEAIVSWAKKAAEKDPEPRAIVDFLASNLIEHYHLMWALSSRPERLLLYRIAHGHVPNLDRAYSLRSLVKRGLVVLGPYPRTMNKSFAQFVRHVEKPETIKNWRRTQEHGSWEPARLLFALALPMALGVLILAAIRNGESLASIVPLFVAAFPALIHALGAAKRTAAA